MSKAGASMLGQKCEEYLKTWRECDETLELAPHQVGVHPENRGGADPNVQVLQNKILASFHKDGYDPSRHLPPIVVRCSSESKKAALLASNKRFTEGRPGLPPIDEKRMEYGTIAGSHLTLALRCVESDAPCWSSGFGAKKLIDKQPNLKLASTRGLKYWVLKEDTPLEVIQAISSWRNQDQNVNQAFHEMELMVLIDRHTSTEVKNSSDGKVSLATVTALVTREAPLRLSDKLVQGQARFVLQFYKERRGDLIKELCSWHAANVDPAELVLLPSVYETLGNAGKFESLENAPLTRLYLAIASYTAENAILKQRPSPDNAHLFNNQDIDTFLKKPPGPSSPHAPLHQRTHPHLKRLQHAPPRTSMHLSIRTSGLWPRCRQLVPPNRKWPEDKWAGRRIDRWGYGSVGGYIVGLPGRSMDAWMRGWMIRWMDGWMDGWVDR